MKSIEKKIFYKVNIQQILLQINHERTLIKNYYKFLEGLDFYYLSNETQSFVVPACIEYGIEKSENDEDLEYLIFFLLDKNRVNKYVNNKKN